jgi:hypothetical protein
LFERGHCIAFGDAAVLLPTNSCCEQILDGLCYLEEVQVLHRDFKPANVLCNTAGDIKLADFGVSRKLLATYRAKTFVGTLRYMAVRQWNVMASLEEILIEGVADRSMWCG